MQRLSSGVLIRAWGISALIVTALIVTGTLNYALVRGQDMQNMPGMSKKSSPQKKRAPTRKRKPAKKHNMANMPGMNMPGMSMSGMHKHTRRKKRTARRRQSNTKHQMGNMPGMSMPGMKMPATKTSPTPKPSPQMNMPGMIMPQSNPSPSASPQKMEMNMPGMQMPTATPNPQASPQQKKEMNMPMPSASPGASPQKMEMNMPMPSASPGASPQKMDMNMPMPGASPSPGAMENMKGMENMPGMGSMNMGPLAVMTGDEMSIRVGSSETNLMDVGQMGSGTSWQPDTSPAHMMDKQAGNWFLMLHYNAVVGVNAQGGLRGVTKFESSNWLMPMAFHKLGNGTLQLRGMFSFEPFTFARGGSPLLFQTGETFKGQPLVDRQHPHDLWMELSAQYTMALGERGSRHLDHPHSCIALRRRRIHQPHCRITFKTPPILVLVSSQPVSPIGGSSWKVRFSTVANQTRIATTSKRIPGTHVRCDCRLRPTGTGRCKSATDFSGIPKPWNRVTSAEQPHQSVTTGHSIVAIGPQASSGAAIT